LIFFCLFKKKKKDIKGIPGRTKTGELSVYSSQINLLAPTLHAIPYKSGLSDPVNINFKNKS